MSIRRNRQRWQLGRLAVIVAAMFAFGAHAEVQLAEIFASDMVMQRDAPIRVWGSAGIKETVTVDFGGQSVYTKADIDGKWSVELAQMSANTVGQTMTVTGDGTGSNSIVLTNILVGDVWLCCGQSNMEMSYHDDNTLIAPFMPEAVNYPTIRRIKISGDVVGEYRKDKVNVKTPWNVCGAETVKDYTLTGYFFARKIVRETAVPIGLIDANVGGERIEPFMAPWQEPGMRRFDLMLYPLTRFAIKGAIWYQGCSNDTDCEAYRFKLQQLVAGWRTAFNLPAMPFYYVQLSTQANPQYSTSAKGGDLLARVREGQRMALTMIPEPVGLAVAVDVGNEAPDIHPHNKYDVGERLAAWALKKTYGQDTVVVSGPLYRSIAIEGNKARLSFDYADGLKVANKTGIDAPVTAETSAIARQFSIAGADGEWQYADTVEFDNGDVLVSSANVAAPVAVRYAYRGAPEKPFVYNSANLPMVPFRTDYDEDEFGVAPNWTPKVAIALPEAAANLVYTGSAQTGVAGSDGYTLSDVFAATDAGDYTAKATLNDGYKWEDGVATPSRTINWSIAKATPTLQGELSIFDWAVGGEASAPSGLSTDFGSVVYRYYADDACTQVLAGAPTAAGTYYVRGEVDGTENWNAAFSSAQAFQVLEAGGSGDDEPDPAALTLWDGSFTLKGLDDHPTFTVTVASCEGDAKAKMEVWFGDSVDALEKIDDSWEVSAGGTLNWNGTAIPRTDYTVAKLVVLKLAYQKTATSKPIAVAQSQPQTYYTVPKNVKLANLGNCVTAGSAGGMLDGKVEENNMNGEVAGEFRFNFQSIGGVRHLTGGRFVSRWWNGDWRSRMAGVKFQYSLDGSNWTDLYTVPAQDNMNPMVTVPANPVWQPIVFPAGGVDAQYFRWTAQVGGNVVEFELYTDETRLTSLAPAFTACDTCPVNYPLTTAATTLKQESDFDGGGMKFTGTLTDFASPPDVYVVASRTNFGTSLADLATWRENGIQRQVENVTTAWTYDFNDLANGQRYYYTAYVVAKEDGKVFWDGKVYSAIAGEGHWDGTTTFTATFKGSDYWNKGVFRDGSATTVDWSRGGTGETYLTYDLGADFTTGHRLSRVRLYYRTNSGNRLYGGIIQVSNDGTQWKDVLTLDSTTVTKIDSTDRNYITEVQFTDSDAYRYVRLNATGCTASNNLELNEFEVLVVAREGSSDAPLKAETPVVKAGLVYTGSEQLGVEAREGSQLAGEVTATAAGVHVATATLAEGYEWEDGWAEPTRTINWSIAKATPTLQGELSIFDWEVGEEASAPSGLAADFGSVVYRYYADEDCTQALDGAPTAAGTYYVRGEVDGTENWNAALSSAQAFQVLEAGGSGGGDEPDPTISNIWDGSFTLKGLDDHPTFTVTTQPIEGNAKVKMEVWIGDSAETLEKLDDRWEVAAAGGTLNWNGTAIPRTDYTVAKLVVLKCVYKKTATSQPVTVRESEPKTYYTVPKNVKIALTYGCVVKGSAGGLLDGKVEENNMNGEVTGEFRFDFQSIGGVRHLTGGRFVSRWWGDDWRSRMAGVKFQCSLDGSNWTDLYTVPAKDGMNPPVTDPANPVWQPIVFPAGGVDARYFRWSADVGGNVVEFELYTDETRLTSLAPAFTACDTCPVNYPLTTATTTLKPESDFDGGGMKFTGTLTDFASTPDVYVVASRTDLGDDLADWQANGDQRQVANVTKTTWDYDFNDLAAGRRYYYTAYVVAKEDGKVFWTGNVFSAIAGEGHWDGTTTFTATFKGSDYWNKGVFRDGSATTVDWNRGGTGETYLTYDLGENFTRRHRLSRVRLYYRTNSGNRLYGGIIQVSNDGTQWKDVLTLDSTTVTKIDSTDRNYITEVMFTNRDAYRYVRLNATGCTEINNLELNEFEVLVLKRNSGLLVTFR